MDSKDCFVQGKLLLEPAPSQMSRGELPPEGPDPRRLPPADRLRARTPGCVKAMSTGPRHSGSQRWKEQVCLAASHTHCTDGATQAQRGDATSARSQISDSGFQLRVKTQSEGA